MSHPQNVWLIACPSSRLGAQQIMAVTLLDEPVVIYRDAEGVPHALENRCCHRGVELSLGRVTNDGHLACGYHGWEYDGDGRCVHVPSLCAGTPVPKGFRVRSYRCIEQDFYIWAWMGDAEPQPEAPPRIRDLALHGWRQGTVRADCRADFLMENILDSSHVPFVHKGTHPSYFFNRINGFVEYDYELRVTERGLIVFYPPLSDADAEFSGDDVSSYLQFELPDRIYVFQRGAKHHFHLVLHLVREAENRSRIEWIMVDVANAPGSVTWDDNYNTTLNQDRVILESAQTNYDRAGADFERHVPADFPLLQLRKAVEIFDAGEWPARRHELTQRKLVRVRQ
ncbi:aromatic ring-hydroxylating dioxygenase subunit alpha [Burkholderia sp. Bp8963]|uniref:aromatic ring-hydroxylating oxygenase subunit alpha n=1 Tax=Burkholderia sp. Bp8963 TaxID=2184547 RepID=UPI000F5AC3F3|nr:aromatic ring-hydroxylating dioxygenase subunit alpha [Burkholderia sp. Bp8963]RQS64131.1 aromatic ring-hydroxylating dioxygenase subunit alpha [Burkholderia sp. Bp8963]